MAKATSLTVQRTTLDCRKRSEHDDRIAIDEGIGNAEIYVDRPRNPLAIQAEGVNQDEQTGQVSLV